MKHFYSCFLFTIFILSISYGYGNTNIAPTNIALSASSINENVPANATVGTLSSTDSNSGDTFTYALVSGTGSTDNAFFNISGDNLNITNSPDFETKNRYLIRVRTTDLGGLTFEKEFTITINDLNEMAIPATHLHFDGTNDNVVIPDAAAYDFTTAYTIEANVKLDRINGFTQTLVSKFEDNNDQRSWMINFGEKNADGALSVIMTPNGIWQNQLRWDSGFIPAVGTWYHVAIVFDSTLSSNQVKLFVNGTLFSQTTWIQTLTPTQANVYIGGYDDWNNGFNSGASSRFF